MKLYLLWDMEGVSRLFTRDILAWTTGAPVQGEEEAGRD